MDTAQWAQGIGVVKVAAPPAAAAAAPGSMEGMSNKSVGGSSPTCMIERRSRAVKEQALNCPRCNSTNTKFCYYNNYSLSQPRYFCKACRRYWTEGGSLRNVPVGGGSRKNKRSTPSSSSTTSSSSSPLITSAPKKLISHIIPDLATHPPKIIHQAQDLNLSFPPPPPPPTTTTHHRDEDEYSHNLSKFIQAPFSATTSTSNSASTTTHHHDEKANHHHHHNHHDDAMVLLKSGISGSSSRGLSSFMYGGGGSSSSAGFPMHEFKQGLNFGLEGFENGYGGLHGLHHQEGNSGARMLFPVEDLKQQHQVESAEDGFDQHHKGDSAPHGFWNGMLGAGAGGASW